MPSNNWLVFGLGALALWAFSSRREVDDDSSPGQLASIVGSAMESSGVGAPVGQLDPRSPTSSLIVGPTGTLFESPPALAATASANDEDIGVLPLIGGQDTRVSPASVDPIQQFFSPVPVAPLAQDAPVVLIAPPTPTIIAPPPVESFEPVAPVITAPAPMPSTFERDNLPYSVPLLPGTPGGGVLVLPPVETLLHTWESVPPYIEEEPEPRRAVVPPVVSRMMAPVEYNQSGRIVIPGDPFGL